MASCHVKSGGYWGELSQLDSDEYDERPTKVSQTRALQSGPLQAHIRTYESHKCLEESRTEVGDADRCSMLW